MCESKWWKTKAQVIDSKWAISSKWDTIQNKTQGYHCLISALQAYDALIFCVGVLQDKIATTKQQDGMLV